MKVQARTQSVFSATSLDQIVAKIIEVMQADHAVQLRCRVLANYTWQGITESQILPLLQKAVIRQWR